MDTAAAMLKTANSHMERRYGGPRGNHTIHVERDLDTSEGTTVCYSVEVEVDGPSCSETGRVVEVSGPERHSPLCLPLGAALTLTAEEQTDAANDFWMAYDEDRADRRAQRRGGR